MGPSWYVGGRGAKLLAVAPSFRLPAEELAKHQALADQLGVSWSDFAREALRLAYVRHMRRDFGAAVPIIEED